MKVTFDPSWAKEGDVELVVLSTWEEYRMFIKSVDAGAHLATLSTKRYSLWG